MNAKKFLFVSLLLLAGMQQTIHGAAAAATETIDHKDAKTLIPFINSTVNQIDDDLCNIFTKLFDLNDLLFTKINNKKNETKPTEIKKFKDYLSSLEEQLNTLKKNLTTLINTLNHQYDLFYPLFVEAELFNNQQNIAFANNILMLLKTALKYLSYTESMLQPLDLLLQKTSDVLMADAETIDATLIALKLTENQLLLSNKMIKLKMPKPFRKGLTFIQNSGHIFINFKNIIYDGQNEDELSNFLEIIFAADNLELTEAELKNYLVRTITEVYFLNETQKNQLSEKIDAIIAEKENIAKNFFIMIGPERFNLANYSFSEMLSLIDPYEGLIGLSDYGIFDRTKQAHLKFLLTTLLDKNAKTTQPLVSKSKIKNFEIVSIDNIFYLSFNKKLYLLNDNKEVEKCIEAIFCATDLEIADSFDTTFENLTNTIKNFLFKNANLSSDQVYSLQKTLLKLNLLFFNQDPIKKKFIFTFNAAEYNLANDHENEIEKLLSTVKPSDYKELLKLIESIFSENKTLNQVLKTDFLKLLHTKIHDDQYNYARIKNLFISQSYAQTHLLKKIALFLLQQLENEAVTYKQEIENRKKIIKQFANNGFCAGLTTVYLFAALTTYRQIKRMCYEYKDIISQRLCFKKAENILKKNALESEFDNIPWFNEVRKLLLSWNKETTFSPLEEHNIDRFIQLILLLQAYSSEIFSDNGKLEQHDLELILQNQLGISPKLEKKIIQEKMSQKTVVEALKSIIFPEHLILFTAYFSSVSSPGRHVVGIFQNPLDKTILLYDANSPNPDPLIFKDNEIDQLVDALLSCLNDKTTVMPKFKDVVIKSFVFPESLSPTPAARGLEPEPVAAVTPAYVEPVS